MSMLLWPACIPGCVQLGQLDDSRDDVWMGYLLKLGIEVAGHCMV